MTSASSLSRLVVALTLFLGVCVLLSVPLASPQIAQAISTTVVISEVEADPILGSTDTANEWFELQNISASTITLNNWTITDNTSSDTIPNIVLGPGGHVIVAATSAGFSSEHPSFSGTVISISDSAIGNGLANAGNKLELRDGSNVLIDCMNWGTNTTCFTLAATGTNSNQTLQRDSSGTDTDTAADWTVATESPDGNINQFTATPTNTATNTFTPTSSNTPTDTFTPTDTPTETATPTASDTPTDTDTPTVTDTATDTLTPTETATETKTSTPSDTPTEAQTPTDTATNTPSNTPSDTNTPTDTTTPTSTPTSTITATDTATPTASNTHTPTNTATSTPTPPTHLVISQIYGAGGNSGATYQNDFIEIFNPSSVSVSLNGWSVQYAAATGTSWSVTNLTNVSLLPGQYYLVQESGSVANGVPLPTADATGTTTMAATAGKVALVNSTSALSGACPLSSSVADFVGYGTMANCFEGAGRAPAPSTTNADFRKVNGCQDTDNNATDFVATAVSPRNSTSSLNYCQTTATPTSTPTVTDTPTVTPSPTATTTASMTATGTAANTPTVTGTVTETNTPTSTPSAATHIVISEFRTTGPNGANDEFIELFNPTNVSISLNGWKIARSNGSGVITNPHHTIGNVTLQPGQHFLMTRTGTNPYSGSVAGDETFGSGITNNGGLALLMPNDSIVDQVGLSATSAYQEGTPLVAMTSSPNEQSYERQIGGMMGNCIDTNDNAQDFFLNSGTSNPQNLASAFTYCAGVLTATPTNTATNTLTGTPTHTSTPFPTNILVNEFLPHPGSDWNGDTFANTDDEWIEIYNGNAFPIDMGGWKLDDINGAGSSPYTIPSNTTIAAHGFLIFYRSQTNIALNDSSPYDDVRLLDPASTVADAYHYSSTAIDQSHSRNPDGVGTFTTSCAPTPNATNCVSTPTPTPSNTLTPTRTHTVSLDTPTQTPTMTATVTPSIAAPTHLVISQIYGGGGNSGATYQHDFIEIFNPGTVSVNLNGWSVQYAGASGTNWSNKTDLPNFTLAPGQYFLIQEHSAAAIGTPLPTTDASGNINLSSSSGKVALVSTTTLLSDSGCPLDVRVVDFVGYGTTPNCSETAPTGDTLSNTSAAFRKSSGCQDTDDNSADFDELTPGPRNSASPLNHCQATATPTTTPTPTPSNTAVSGTPTFTATATQTLTSTQTPLPALHLVISELRSRGPSGASDEFVEIFNPTNATVNLSGWKIRRSSGCGTTLANMLTFDTGTQLAPGQHFLAAALTSTNESSADKTYNAGLADSGGIALTLADNTVIDAVGMCATTTFVEGNSLAPFVSSVDQSYERKVGGTAGNCIDTNDNASDFLLNASSSNPQNLASALTYCAGVPTATPTNTPTTGPSPTATPTRTNTPGSSYSPLDVVINEVAWAGTQASSSDEWIELYNNTNNTIDLDGWTLQADDGTPNIALVGTISAHGYYLLERTDDATVNDILADHIYTGALENSDEPLTLRDPASNVIDTANQDGGAWSAGTSSPPCSMERIDSLSADTDANWATNDNITRNGHDADNNEICGTPKNQNSTTVIGPTRTPTVTATPTQTGTPAPGGLFVNEFMPDPEQDWNNDSVADDDDEWIEIFNANGFSVNLSGWMLDDVENGGSDPYVLPNGTTIDAQSFLTFFRANTNIALNNTNDDVRLLKPDSSVADTISYKSSESNASWSRSPDGAAYFTLYCPPTPNASNCSIAPTPTITPTPYAQKIFINEFLPAPYRDWNHDKKLDAGDEWIELYNSSNHPIDLSGWQLDDAKSGSFPFEIPDGTIIGPKAFLLYFASETTLGLNNDGDTVRLLHPDDTVADVKQYDPIETNASYARNPDASPTWVNACIPTPGVENCSIRISPTPTRIFSLTPISDARNLPDGTLVSVLGSVVAHPCELDEFGHELTLSDGIAGIDVYLDFPDRFSCKLPRGEQIVVTGIVRDHFGLRSLYPRNARDIARHYDVPREIAPRQIHTGDVNEETESTLVMIQGKVSNGKNGDAIWVNDGTGMVEVYADPISHATFEGITRGSIVRVYGIAHQYNKDKLPTEGYYIRPRAAEDVLVLELAEKLPNAPGNRGGLDLGPVSIEQALATRNQNYVTVGGIVTVPPGLLSERDFWIQDVNGNGARIFVATSAGQPPKLKLHENVSVRGRVVSSFGAREIRVELADAIGAHGVGPAISPRAIKTGAIDFSNEGALIEIQGFVAREKGREIYIDDGSGEVLVYIDSSTRIRWPRLHVGDPARIVGIVTRFRGEPEILPRYQSDVQFGVVLLPVAGGVDNSFLRKLRTHGRVGEDLALTSKFTAHAASRVVHSLQRVASKSNAPTIKQNRSQEFPTDPFAIASFLLLAASGVSATIALKKYRASRTIRHKN